jgi:hypothetical protein
MFHPTIVLSLPLLPLGAFAPTIVLTPLLLDLGAFTPTILPTIVLSLPLLPLGVFAPTIVPTMDPYFFLLLWMMLGMIRTPPLLIVAFHQMVFTSEYGHQSTLI